MPYKDSTKRLCASADSMRKMRLYRAAVAAGNPNALAAERERVLAREPMRAFNILRNEKDKLPAAERERLKDAPEGTRLSRLHLQRVHAECMAVDRDAARAEYKRLRAEVIKEAQFAAIMA